MQGPPTRQMIGLSLVAVVFLTGGCRPASHGQQRRFSDAGLARRADATCARGKADIARLAPAPPSASFEERAQRVEQGADALDRVVGALRALAPAGQDAAFDHYVTTWQQFNVVGRQYATAIRTGDPSVYQPAGNRGDAMTVELNRIAKANGLSSCLAIHGGRAER